MPRREKVSAAEKVQLVRQYLAGELGVSEAGRLAGVDHRTVSQWIARYEAEGAEVFLPYERNRVYSPELKKKAVRDYLTGTGSRLEICKKYRLRDVRQLSDWIKVYNAHGDFSSVKFCGEGSYIRTTRRTTQEERIQIAQECLALGKTTVRWC